MKRIVSVILVVLVLLTAAPLAGFVGLDIVPQAKALAETGSCGDNGDNVTWKFDASTGMLTISGTGEMKHYASGSPFGNNKEIKSVIINRGVTNIAGSAFYKCTSLKNVTIGSSVTIIGGRAFQYCSALTALTIPDGVTKIEGSAFEKCTAITNISIGKNVTHIGNDAFRDCDALKSVKIPDNVTTIGGYAFTSCDSLADVTIGNGVLSINSSTFYGCKSLANVIIGNSVTKIGGAAFSNCSALKNVSIGNSVTQIGEFAFTRCSALTSVSIPNSTTSIDKAAFEYCSSLSSVTFGNSVTHIGNDAFRNCDALKSVTIPDNVTTIGGYAFTNCDSLSEVTIGNGVTNINSSMFYGCKSLTTVIIGNSVTKIGGAVFSNCTALKTVTMPKSVMSIDKYAFNKCTSLKDVYYTGTEEQWNDLKKSIAGSNSCLTNATIHYNSAGLPNSSVQPTEPISETPAEEQQPTMPASSNANEPVYNAEMLPKTIPPYPAKGQKYWIIFNEGFRKNRLEMSTFDVSENATEIKVVWNGNIVVHSDGKVSSSNQFHYTENEWVYDRSYGIITDKTSKILASNIDIFNSNEEIVVHASNELQSYGFPSSNFKTISAPTNFKVAEKNTDSLKLTWNEVNNATGYEVYQYNTSKKEYTKLGVTNQNYYNVKKLKGGTTYRFRIKSFIENNGKTLWSNPSSVLKATTLNGVLKVFIDRSTYSYFERESFCIIAGVEVNGKLKKPTNMKVWSSSSTIVKAGNTYDISSRNYLNDMIQTQNRTREKLGLFYTHTIKKESLIDNTNVCVLQALKPGSVAVTVSCDDAKEKVLMHVSVFKDALKEYRANTFQSTYFKSSDAAYATGGGLFIKNFKCSKSNGDFQVSMDVWNRLACYGALEVYDAKGKLVNVEMIKKWQGQPTSIKESAVAYWHIVSDAFNTTTKGTKSYEWKTLSKKTSLSFTVPRDGYFRITNDAAQSSCCYMYNMMDLFLASFFLTKDVMDTVNPTPDVKQDPNATEETIRKSVKSFILEEAKQNTVKTYMKQLSKGIGVEFTLSMASDYLGTITGIADEFFKKIDVQPLDLLKGASKTATSVAEKGFTKWLEAEAPATTKAIKAVLNVDSGINIYYQIKAFLFDTYNKNFTVLLYAPVDSSLAKPIGLKVTATNTTKVNLRWDPVTDASGYIVYQYNTSTKKYTKVGATKTNAYKVTGLKAGKTYRFAVRAYRKVDGKNYYSAYSAIIKATTKKA